MESDRALITAALRIQEFRGWSDDRLVKAARIEACTWTNLVESRSPRLHPKTRAKLESFVAAWPNDRRDPDEALTEAARGIQERREWSDSICAALAGITGTTWGRIVRRRLRMHRATRASLEAFVAAWSDDSRPGPRRHRRHNGQPFGQPKVTRLIRQAIVESPKPAREMAIELGLSAATVYRIRLRDRVMREAS